MIPGNGISDMKTNKKIWIKKTTREDIDEGLVSSLIEIFLNNRGKIDIRALLAARGIQQKELAKRLKICPTVLCRIIKGNRKSPAIRKIIAGELGVKPSLLWAQIKP